MAKKSMIVSNKENQNIKQDIITDVKFVVDHMLI